MSDSLHDLQIAYDKLFTEAEAIRIERDELRLRSEEMKENILFLEKEVQRVRQLEQAKMTVYSNQVESEGVDFRKELKAACREVERLSEALSRQTQAAAGLVSACCELRGDIMRCFGTEKKAFSLPVFGESYQLVLKALKNYQSAVANFQVETFKTKESK